LYPDKPHEISGQAFGHRYSFLDEQDTQTSYNLPQLIEFYANFGPLGVLVGMLLIGLIYRTIDHLYFHANAGLGAVVGGIYIVVKLLAIETALSIVLGSVFWCIAFLAVMNVMTKVAESIGTRAPA
jgi:hypothetical protein